MLFARVLVDGIALGQALERPVELDGVVLDHAVHGSPDADAEGGHRVEREDVEMIVGDHDQRVGRGGGERAPHVAHHLDERLHHPPAVRSDVLAVVVAVEHVRHRRRVHDPAHTLLPGASRRGHILPRTTRGVDPIWRAAVLGRRGLLRPGQSSGGRSPPLQKAPHRW